YSRTRRQFLAGTGLAIGAGLAGCTRGGMAGSENASNTTTASSSATDLGLDPYRKADIDWKAHEGTSINIGAVQHAWVESIKPYIPVFEELTGIDVIWTILPENQFRTKRLTDVSTGAGS